MESQPQAIQPGNNTRSDLTQRPGKLEQLAQRWLDIQCKMIRDVVSAQLIAFNSEQEKLRCLASWPKAVPEHDMIGKQLLDCLKTNKYLVSKGHAEHKGALNRIAFPLLKTDHFHYVVMLDIRPRNELMVRSVINMLQWGQNWFRFAYIQPEPVNSVAYIALWDSASRCLEQKDFQSATASLVSQLATNLRCSRVSYGRWRANKVQVQALSHTASFSRKAEAIQRLAAAMFEAATQDCITRIPANSGSIGSVCTQAHEWLSESSLNGSLCSVPISSNGELFAVVTLERELENPFSDAEVRYVEHLVSLLAVNLMILARQSDNFFVRAQVKLEQLKSKCLGANSGGLKLKLAAAVLLILFLSFADGDYKVTSPAMVEGRIQRTVVAPQDGFLASASVRAGDIVNANQSMGRLDNKDLKLEQLSIGSEQQELLGKYRAAQAEHDNAEVGVIAAQIDQANARMQLVNEKLKRTQLLAPFDGVVIKGDLSQSLGSPVAKGDVLFTVAPLNDYRILIKVAESDIAPIEPGLMGTLVLTSLPGKKIPVQVEGVTSVSTAQDSTNYFRVTARLIDTEIELRPGMEGAAKLVLGERSLTWIWTHKLVDWVKLKIWAWLP